MLPWIWAHVVGRAADVVLDEVATLEHGHLGHAGAHLHAHEVPADRTAVALAPAAPLDQLEIGGARLRRRLRLAATTAAPTLALRLGLALGRVVVAILAAGGFGRPLTAAAGATTRPAPAPAALVAGLGGATRRLVVGCLLDGRPGRRDGGHERCLGVADLGLAHQGTLGRVHIGDAALADALGQLARVLATRPVGVSAVGVIGPVGPSSAAPPPARLRFCPPREPRRRRFGPPAVPGSPPSSSPGSPRSSAGAGSDAAAGPGAPG